MDLTAWIVFLCAITFTLSQKMELCRKKADCVPTQPSNIRFFGRNPNGDTKYSPPGPITLRCEATGDVDMIRWIRNNSDGESKVINSTSLHNSTFLPNLKVGRLHDFPKNNKFPYTYQCIAFGKCCDEHRSPSITVVEPKIVIHDIRPNDRLSSMGFFGYGKVEISCTGEGDNLTRVFWNRTDENGNIIILNTTILDHKSGGVWQAKLVYRPNPVNVSYTYKCIAENKCCRTEISVPRTISFNPTFNCGFDTFAIVKELDEIIAIPKKHSVKISWKYDFDPEDTGLVIRIPGASQDKITFNLTARREYVFLGLDPNKLYIPRYQILFNTRQGKSCATFSTSHGSFVTLPDVPSRPRNVKVIVKQNTLNVSWDAPKYINGDDLHFIISWRRVASNKEYQQRNVTESPYVIKYLSGFSTYQIKIEAANVAGIGNSSEQVSASTQEGPKIVIHDIRPNDRLSSMGFFGYGKVEISCTGEGDNLTRVFWNRTDENGNIIILNTTILDHKSGGVWQAKLVYRPNPVNVSYTYKCIAENKCCRTEISDARTISFNPTFNCGFDTFAIVKELDEIIAIPKKHSVKISWKYDFDPEDTGLVIRIPGASQDKITFNLTARREYVFLGLDPNKQYIPRYQILFNTRQGKSCATFSTSHGSFVTLPDVPSRPRNVKVIVKRNTLNVSWEAPRYISGGDLHFLIFWRRVASNQEYQQRNATESPYVIKDLSGFSTYHIKLQAANVAGIGNSSELVSASTQEGPGPYIRIIAISSDIKTHNYTGFGRVSVSCNGQGDNATKVYWTRTDKDGDSISLNTTILRMQESSVVVGSPGKWRADLLGRPDTTKFPYTYKCIVENNCCLTKMSSMLNMRYTPPPDGECPLSAGVNVIKPIQVDSAPNERSVTFNWQYHSDPEDTGFSFSVRGASPAKNLSIAAREYIVRGLEPNKNYNYSYNILYGKGCKTFAAPRQFTTLPDYPSRPRNVTVIAEGIALNVSWLPPKYLNGEFKHYKLSSKNIDKNTSASINVTTTSFVLEDLEELTTYSFRVFAVNNVGIGNSSLLVFAQTDLRTKQTLRATDDSLNTGAIAGGVVGAILFIILVFLIFLWVQRRIGIKEHEESVRIFYSKHRTDNPTAASEIEPQHDTEPLSKKTDIPDELSYIVLLEDWEIAPDDLKILDKKLGGGQFGIVMQGLLTTAKGDSEVVAVKILKDSAKESDLQDLMTELTILKEVNKVPHPNVIRLIGGCSIGGKLHVITELCTGGNLRHLLINSRVYPSEENSSNYINLSSTLNHRQLVKIAADISNGMVHLSSQKFVHRDLAARNILIGEDNMAKVSDFGLARDVGGAEEYIRNNQNLLPVKWMALESLLHGRFTIASDVWSYGVLLHEITTLGEEPYKNISPYNIVSHVGSGCRMSQPPQCSDDVYEIMTKCWKVEPAERPTFEDIYVSLQNMLMDNEKSYINIAQVIDEGTITEKTEPKIESTKDGAIRYTKA